ncbi:hypothetical protein ACPPVO_35685 [Dactylosporangium sp. McL0621]|uniref:hypothetical protein n=1 Tax=Dactylosporangium sp. McL0621 TaxID=3415678 RepID=UPI003CF53C21
MTIQLDLLAQVCAIRSPGKGAVQAAVIVRNNRSSTFSLTAHMDLMNSSHVQLNTWACPLLGVEADSWEVCFSSTVAESSPVNSTGDAYSHAFGLTDWV